MLRSLRNTFLLLTAWLCLAVQVKAEYLLSDLNFDVGSWEVVGVSLHNYAAVPLQQEIGTFVLRNVDAMKQMQQEWNLSPTYEDHCDYHYVLKFYRDKQLVKSLKINLQCNYITAGAMSYGFDPQLLVKHQDFLRQTPWSFVRYTDLTKLRNAMTKLKSTPNIYIFQDVRPYEYDGVFTLRTDGHAWNVNRDSLRTEMEKQVKQLSGNDNFYLVPYLLFMDNNWKLSFRFDVYCNEDLYTNYATQAKKNVSVKWQRHFAIPNDFVIVTIVGLNQDMYNKLIYGAQ